ncbi:hypothetical protein G7Y89_g1433 [Cudoniella acicularis]|uniref:Pheromone a factor receptor n=1 Tax=Cudoniella acicularis TaxID=354080 RepID=A0A8H4RX97_9HELO|nr:hypothetical protein G7Y89_g1433 [Cudoniella acicularis]
MSNSIASPEIPTTLPKVIQVPNPPDFPYRQADPINAIALPTMAALAIAGTYLPWRDFWRKRNLAACSMIASNTIVLLYTTINAIIWPNDDWSTWWEGVGLCDLEVTTKWPLTVVTNLALVCFVKNLASVFNTRKNSFVKTSAMRRRQYIVDFLIIFTLPIIQVAVWPVLSTGRFSIFAVTGCVGTADPAWPTILIIIATYPIYDCLGAYFAKVKLGIGLFKYRKAIGDTLSSSGTGMNTKYFVKLSIISLTVVTVWFPLNIYYMYLNRPDPVHGWSYKADHNPLVWNPILFYNTGLVPHIQYLAWGPVAFSLFIFFFFGFNHEAIDTYRSCLVLLGFGFCFPSLKAARDPTAPRRYSDTLDKLDIVSRVMKYFDQSTRKNSSTEGTTIVNSLNASTSRPGAIQGSGSGTQHSSSSSSQADNDTIQPVPTEDSWPPTYDKSPSFSRPQQKSFLSAFRTHLTFPFPLFHSKSKNVNEQPISATNITNTDRDMEKGMEVSCQPAELTPEPQSVMTNIWSDGMMAHPGQPVTLPDSDKYVQGPKMGTREYREREKRNTEEAKKNGVPGVVVKKSFDQKEG